VGTYTAWEPIRRGKVLLRCVCSAARKALGRPRGEERGGGILCRLAHSLLLTALCDAPSWLNMRPPIESHFSQYTQFMVYRSLDTCKMNRCLLFQHSPLITPTPLIGGGIKRRYSLTSVCLSLCRVHRPKWRTKRPRKTKIGTEVAHVTRDSDTIFEIKRSRSPGRFADRRVGASGGCSGGRGNVLAVGNCCYVAVCSAAQGASAPTGGGEGRGISWRSPAYSLFQV